MRSYGKNKIYASKNPAQWKERANREATEWDVRLDVSTELPVEEIVNNLKQQEETLLYALVSGVEKPDINTPGPAKANEDHVHLAIIMLNPCKRKDVLQLCRGQRKRGDEYCVPRNPKFTYAGWVGHHAKIAWKLDGEPGIRYESGVLPMDAFTDEVAANVVKMIQKYAPELQERFNQYFELHHKGKLMAKYLELKKLVGDDIKKEFADVACQTEM